MRDPAREAGIARAEEHAAPTFNEVALNLLEAYAMNHREVFCDDFWDWVKDKPMLPETHELRALGAVYRKAAHNKWIEKSGKFRSSKGAGTGPRPIWRSLIFAERPFDD